MRHATFGAIPTGEGVRFAVWAPAAERVVLHLEPSGGAVITRSMTRDEEGCFCTVAEEARPGDRYGFRLDDGPVWPDPASRFQPEGVHALSEIVDPATFAWNDEAWRGLAPGRLVVYELHVGSFTEAGTFDAAAERLPYLAELGVTAVELMPVAAFPGGRSWGYDGAALFAPSERYGRPDALRRLVDRAHALGLLVLVDVVYNHLGPDGAYLAAFSPAVFSTRHRTPWGAGLNFDEPGSRLLRRFFIENALSWLIDYHVDGLRLDATHAIEDDSRPHFLAELAAAVRRSVPGPPRQLIAEDSRNLDVIARPVARGGWGLDAVWADDLHHAIRVHTAGDRDGYYADYTGTTAEIVKTIRNGWLYRGEHSRFRQGARGTDPSGLPAHAFVVCLQNHDQIGNRALGERLSHQVALEVYRAASALVLLAPETPLLFMGQEWAASTPFLYFSDHEDELGRLVTEGRRDEFRSFRAFSDPRAREAIPDPQAGDTFLKSRLRWDERFREPHGSMLAYYRALLALRRELTGRPTAALADEDAWAPDAGTVVLRRPAGPAVLIVAARLSGSGAVTLPAERLRAAAAPGPLPLHLSSEDRRYCADPLPLTVDVDPSSGAVTVGFARPGAVAFVMDPDTMGKADLRRVRATSSRGGRHRSQTAPRPGQHVPSTAEPRVHLRRRARGRALSVAPGRRRLLLVAVPDGAAGQPARLRHLRPQPAQSRARR